ncbi:MAG: hypothetical protein Kow009_05310 [Spirochaetales bacterium]
MGSFLSPVHSPGNLSTGFLVAFLGSFGTLSIQWGISPLIERIPAHPAIPHPVYVKAKEAYIRNDLLETIQLLAPAGKVPELDPAAAILLGKANFFLARYSEAERIWKGLLDKVPHHPEALKWLARLYLYQGRREEAEQLCSHLVAWDSESPEGLFLLGKARLAKGDTRTALEYLEKGEVSLRKLAEIPLELADLYRQFGIKNRSREKLELALHLLGKDSSLYRTVEESLKALEEP